MRKETKEKTSKGKKKRYKFMGEIPPKPTRWDVEKPEKKKLKENSKKANSCNLLEKENLC